jgi:hypothetical protein
MANQMGRTFQQIWKQMDHGRRRQAAEAFFTSAETAGEKRSITGLIAMKMKLRPQTAAKLPPERAAGYLSTIESLDEPLAALLVRSYLFTHQTPMLAMFLDELHITHKDGVIPDDNTIVPTAEALQEAAGKIRAAFAPEDVQLYLSALSASDAVTWANLGAALTDAPA